MTPAALILDRDGTLIEHVPYLCDPAEVRLLPGVRDALTLAKSAGALLFLHTNQSGVGRGFFDLASVHACNNRLIELLDLGPAPFSRICIAPEHPDHPSEYRKPSPRFSHEIMLEHALSAEQICYIGDRACDLKTAQIAGSQGVGVATGLVDLRQELDSEEFTETFPIFDSLCSAIQYLFPKT